MAGSEKQVHVAVNRVREVVFQIRKLMQAGERYTKALNKKFNVSAPQVATLLTLFDEGPLSPSMIARHIMVNSSTVTGIIDRLEQKGLVFRLRNSPDRRIVTVELTESGKKLAQNAPPPIQQKIVEGLSQLSEQEMNSIVQSLTRLTEMVDAQDLEVETEEEVM
jgi:DNA-binding MarR family transcriptional regulator